MIYKKTISGVMLFTYTFVTLGQNYLFALRPPSSAPNHINSGYNTESPKKLSTTPTVQLTGSLLKQIFIAKSRGMSPRTLLAANPRTPFAAKGIFKAALERDAFVLFELALSQMVVGNHKGYSGLTAQEFADMIHKEAKEMGFPPDRYALHADHISVEGNILEAIQLAKDMIKTSVEAGYTSFTIDASDLLHLGTLFPKLHNLFFPNLLQRNRTVIASLNRMLHCKTCPQNFSVN